MLKRSLFTLTLFLACFYAQAGVLLRFPFAGSTVELLDSAGAAEANSHSDIYTQSLTPFDLQIRLNKLLGATEKDYLARSAAEARNWPEEEQQQLKASFAEIASFLKANNISLNLPKTIQLVKTNGGEEFGAEGYTRENRIILCTGAQQPLNTHLVAHELFHVYSRLNAGKRDAIYALFGFKKCSRIDAAAAMQHSIITNPDCPFIEHYITVDLDGSKKDMVLQLYSRIAYKEGGNLGDYANVGLLEVAGAGNAKKPVMKGGKGVLHELEQVPDFFRQVSVNTPYLLHPEEIAAEHFSMWIIGQKVQQPEYFDRMKAVLAKP